MRGHHHHQLITENDLIITLPHLMCEVVLMWRVGGVGFFRRRHVLGEMKQYKNYWGWAEAPTIVGNVDVCVLKTVLSKPSIRSRERSCLRPAHLPSINHQQQTKHSRARTRLSASDAPAVDQLSTKQQAKHA